MNPVVHFIQTGAELGYAPNKFFLEAREIEPTISYSFFGQKGERHHYIILDKNKNTVAFQEIYTKHVKSRPDYLYVVNSEEIHRLMNFIAIHKEFDQSTNKKILIIVLNKPAYRPKSTNDNNISCVYLEDLSV
ncbi:MAG: hypothetical protein ACK5E0_26100, partial [Bradyrhizobium sp.]|uniref:hypothetical protein n=1 Tax=Bradyrhizobium sp. TaxID=376 RepID=UPI00391CC2FA